MELLIDKEKCTSCGVCVKVCPQMILEIPAKKKPVQVKDIKQCMGCYGCEDECKYGAVRLLRAPQNVKKIKTMPPPPGAGKFKECDVAIVGAGPAGLGAAIACAREGLDVIVFDKLPNQEITHHNDGGVMFSLDGVVSAKQDNGKIRFPEIDVAIDGSVSKKLSFLGMMGPNNVETISDFPGDIDGFVQNKVLFLKELSKIAKSHGAKLWYNIRVVDILKDGNKVCGVRLENGREIKSKVVVTADGVWAKMTEKAGFKVSHEDPVYVCGIRWQFPLSDKSMKCGYQYVHGEMDPGDGVVLNSELVMTGSISVSDSIHVAIGFMSPKKYYPVPKPMNHYIEKFINEDKRVKKMFGDTLYGKKPELIVGFRGRFRKDYIQDRVIDGAIVVGDAWVDELDLGNLNSMTNGYYAGRVIAEASKKNDFSKEALNPANDFVNEALLKYIKTSKRDKLSETVLSHKELEVWFEYAQHFDYPSLIFGSKEHKKKAIMYYMKKNFFRFFKLLKYRKLTPYVLS